MWKQIKAYAILWNPKRRKGIVKIVLPDESEHKMVVKTSGELHLLGSILRNEKLVFYNVKTNSIATGWEPKEEDEIIH